MKFDDWVLFVLTFVTGVVIGVFVYVTGFKPVYAPDELQTTENAAQEFSVTGTSYGGLRVNSSHPSFRLLADGTATFIPGAVGDVRSEPVEGVVPRAITRRIVEAVVESPLIEYGAPAIDKECRVAADGIDYEYQITLSGTVYLLDTCQSVIPYESDLARALEELWEFFADPTSESAGLRPLSDLVGERLQETFVE